MWRKYGRALTSAEGSLDVTADTQYVLVPLIIGDPTRLVLDAMRQMRIREMVLLRMRFSTALGCLHFTLKDDSWPLHQG